MGHRANYILNTNRTIQLYYSHWGARSIPEKLLSGPERTAAYLRALTPVENLSDSGWIEGGILLDSDQHTLIFWGGEIINYYPSARRIFLPIVHALWPGWTVQWAIYGIADFARYLGRDPSKVLTGSFQEGFDTPAAFEELLHTHAEFNATVVTVKHGDGRVADYIFQYLPGYILSAGPLLLDAIVHKDPVPVSQKRPDDFDGGAYLDVAAREMWVWNRDILDPRYLDALARVWPNWSIHGHVEGLVRQVILSGRDPTGIMRPDAEVMALLMDELLSDDPRPSMDFLMRAFTDAPAGDGVTAVVAPHFLSEDPVALTVEERRNLLCELLAHSIVTGDQSRADTSRKPPL
jgi:hypothetical protein